MAVWEIYIGSRGDPVFHAKVMAQRFGTLDAYERIWRETFDADDQAGLDAMHVVLSFLRGLVLYTERDPKTVQAQLALMASGLAHMLKRPRAEGPRSSRGRK